MPAEYFFCPILSPNSTLSGYNTDWSTLHYPQHTPAFYCSFVTSAFSEWKLTVANLALTVIPQV